MAFEDRVARALPLALACQRAGEEVGCGEAVMSSFQFKDEFVQAVDTHDVVAVRSPTGAGKNRYTPKYLSKLGPFCFLTPRVATVISTGVILRKDGADVGVHYGRGDCVVREKRHWGTHGDIVSTRFY